MPANSAAVLTSSVLLIGWSSLMSLCAEQPAHEKRASDCTVPRGACISRDGVPVVSINEHSSCTTKNARLHPCSSSFGTASQRSSSLFIELQPDDSDDLPNLQRSA